MPKTETELIPKAEWQRKAAAHRSRAEEWTVPYRERRAKNSMHPITDFLFIYYRNSPAQLEVWHPGFGFTMEGGADVAGFSAKHYHFEDGNAVLAPEQMDSGSQRRLSMALKLCRLVQTRPPQFGCFGMHEWAMVYRGKADGEVRHGERLPLRLDQDAINTLVESRPIACSHFDAFRFFTPSARRFNRLQPGKDTRFDNEQCGCLHTNMDLYKLTAQCMPWVGSDLLWNSFEFAIQARQLDMQASPYDCSSLGFEAVKIETPEGRQQYERRQRELSELAAPIRAELIQRLEQVLSRASAASPQSSDS
ncbi:MAG: 3-methyladenine DNA glycosylase [Coraliomargarita sp.]|nr:3-methyladenine DNA glycosylase [Coraliomargarita sp.]